MPNRKTAALIGALFLTVMASWAGGYALLNGVLDTANNLATIGNNRTALFFGVLLELVEIGAVIGIVALMYPIMAGYSRPMAIWYICLRTLECMLLLAAIIVPLALITLGQDFIAAGQLSNSWHQTIAAFLVGIRVRWLPLVLPFFYGLSALPFYWIIYKLRLLPIAFTVIGLIGALLIIATIATDYFEFKQASFIGVVGGLTEIVLGLWLIIRGFNHSQIPAPTPSTGEK